MTAGAAAADSAVDQFGSDKIAARVEIQHRIYQFCRAVDRRDLGYARSAFHDDAVDHHGVFEGDFEGLRRWIEERHEALPFSYHLVGNVTIDFATDTDAFVESYVMTWQSVSAETNTLDVSLDETSPDPEILAAGRYVDHFTRRDGAWRIQRRVSFPESFMVVPARGAASGSAAGGWARPARDDSDPAQVLRRELGL